MTVELAPVAVPPAELHHFVDSVVAARQAVMNPDWSAGTPKDTVVGDRAAYIVHADCGDCEATEAYFVVGKQVFVAEWGVDGLEGKTVAERNRAGWQLVASLH